MFNQTDLKFKVLIVSLLINITFLGYFVYQHYLSANMNCQEAIPLINKSINVEVSGGVKRPDVYEVNQGTSYIQLIEQAGGFSEIEYQDQYVLMIELKDEMKLTILKTNYERQLSPVDEEGLININTATIGQLDTLEGIGFSKAQAIIDYRTKNGPFQKIEDIQLVSGIGEKTYEKIKYFICV